jgi:hypothetical protein
MSASEAARRLGVTRAMIGIYVKQGKLKRYGPETRQQKFYKEEEVEALREAEESFFGQTQKECDAVFARAQPSDMEGIENLAARLFGKRSIGADRRRSWLAKEPRGNYVMKRLSDSKVVAYFYILPLAHDTIVDYLHYTIRGWQITDEHIIPFAPGVARECFIGAIGTDPDADQDCRSAYMAVLLRGLRQDLATLAQEGVTMSKLYAASSNFEGTYMCLHLGMELWEPPAHKRLTFVLDVKKSKTFLLQPYKKSLAEWRKRQESG